MIDSEKELIKLFIKEEVERFVQSMAGSSGGANLGLSSANNRAMLGDDESNEEDEFKTTIGNSNDRLTINGPKR